MAGPHVLGECLRHAGMETGSVGNVNAHGLSTIQDDTYEAQSIHDMLGNVPITAPKSFFGHLGAGCGAMELAASLVGLAEGEVPVTLNYEKPDPACPVNVVHGEPLKAEHRSCIKLSSSRLGPAAALLIAAE